MSAVIHYAPPATGAARLGNEIAELCGYIHAATCRLLKLIREFDERRCWEEQGFRSCVEWLNFHCGLGPGAAREHLRVAHALPDLQKIRDAFADGRLSYSKVRAMTRVATHDNEDFLMMVAEHGTADQGELVVKALEMAIETAYDPAEDLPVATRRANALCEIAESYFGHPEHSGSTADRYQVVIHAQAGNAAQLENGPCVSADTLERVSCDFCVTEIEENRHGEALNIGRRSRTIPAAMRRALKAREGGFDCRKGACGEIYFVDRRKQRLAEFQQAPRVSIATSMAWMYRKFERTDVSAETCRAKWYAGDTLDMDYAVWVLANIRQNE